MPTLSENRRAHFDYETLDEFEAGIELLGHEVKSAKGGGMNIANAYVTLHYGAPYLVNATIAPYAKAGRLAGYNRARSRKLLLNASEIKKILGAKTGKNLTIVPLSVYTSRGRIKVKIALARGRKKADKREVIKKRETERDIRRAMER